MARVDVYKTISQARLLADQRESDYVTDQECIDILQSAYDYLYLRIFEKNRDYFRADPLEIRAEGAFIILPEDYHELDALRYKDIGDTFTRVYPKNPAQILNEDTFSGANFFYSSIRSYDTKKYFYIHLANKLQLEPANILSDGDFVLYYTPSPFLFPTDAELKADSGIFVPSMPRGFDHFLKYYLATDISTSENTEIDEMERHLARWEDLIMDSVKKRTNDFPKTVTQAEGYGRYSGGGYGI